MVLLLLVTLCTRSCGFGTEDPEDYLSTLGEPCDGNEDCRNDLVCVDFTCHPAGTPQCPADKQCADLECGPDPVCGAECGPCAGGLFCVDGLCEECMPSCEGRLCGDDGCGGSCGACDGGLVCAYGICAPDLPSQLEWEVEPGLQAASWAEAGSYCGELVSGGHDDWRLPSIDELRTLVDGCPATEWGGACNIGEGMCLAWECRSPKCEMCISSGDDSGNCFWRPELLGQCQLYWSSSPVEDDAGHVWCIGFDIAHIDSVEKGQSMAVRCVR